MKLGEQGLPIRIKEQNVKRYLDLVYIYCPKGQWKQRVRDFKPIKIENVVQNTQEAQKKKII